MYSLKQCLFFAYIILYYVLFLNIKIGCFLYILIIYNNYYKKYAFEDCKKNYYISIIL